MADGKPEGFDLLGIKPLGDAVKSVTQGAIDGASAFLSRICLPAAEEFGLLLRDKVSQWRAINSLRIVQKAEKKLGAPSETIHAHPRIVAATIENGSWSDDDLVQELWAGLLASACTPDGRDESNLIFVNLLRQLTSSEVKILDYGCRVVEKSVSRAGWITCNTTRVPLVKLQEISGVDDYHRLDRELDHLRSLDLISSGFKSDSTSLDLGPTALALHMHVRGQGYRGSPIDYFKLTHEPLETLLERLKSMPLSTVQPKELHEALKSDGAKPLIAQATELSKKYIGLKVDWRGHIFSSHVFGSNSVHISIRTEEGFSAPWVNINVDQLDFPVISKLKDQQRIRVIGIIKSVASTAITLEDILLIEPVQ